MALRDIFKKKKKDELPVEEKIKVAEEKVKTPATPKKERKISDLSWRTLKAPQVTEKATELAKQNQYTFKILPGSNKTEVKKAVEDLYAVDVAEVKILKVPKKRRRVGRIFGWRKGYKKAIVKIKKGQKIEVLPR